jgi:hypothetical protein
MSTIEKEQNDNQEFNFQKLKKCEDLSKNNELNDINIQLRLIADYYKNKHEKLQKYLNKKENEFTEQKKDYETKIQSMMSDIENIKSKYEQQLGENNKYIYDLIIKLTKIRHQYDLFEKEETIKRKNINKIFVALIRDNKILTDNINEITKELTDFKIKINKIIEEQKNNLSWFVTYNEYLKKKIINTNKDCNIKNNIIIRFEQDKEDNIKTIIFFLESIRFLN